MNSFTGTLNHNAWATMLYNAYKNMGIKPNLEGIDSSFVEDVREEGGKLNDKNVYTAIDNVPTRVWDPTDSNVLAFEPTPNFVQKEMVVDKVRQVAITKSYFLDKQIWGNEGAFGEYISLVDSQVSKAKKLYESKLVQVKLGCMESTGAYQQKTVSLLAEATGDTAAEKEAKNRINGETLGEFFSNLEAELKDPSSDYTDIGFYDGFDKGTFSLVWNLEYLNKVKMFDLPTVFHNDYFDFNGKKMLAKFFGNYSAAGTADGTQRAADEYNIRVNSSGEYAATGTTIKTVRPGDVLPTGTPIVDISTTETYANYDKAITIKGKSTKVTYQCYSTVHAYVPDDTIICKIMALGKDIKFLSSFQTDGTFQNYKSNSENIYSTWMFSDVDRTGFYPLITVRKA